MISLDTLSLFFSISENDLIEQAAIALLASPRLAPLLDRFPAIKKVIADDVSVWKANVTQKLKSMPVPEKLATEFERFRQCQTLSLKQFNAALPDLLLWLHTSGSAFAEKAQALIDNGDTRELSAAQQTLFLQRWRLSLTMETAALQQKVLDQERDRLLETIQQQLAVSGQLASVLDSDSDTAAGRLWDMARGALGREDYQLIVQYGDFLAGQPELQTLAEKLGRSREAKATAAKDAPQQTVRQSVREPETAPEEVNGIHQSDDILRLLPPELATLGINELEFEFYRRLAEKRLLTYRLQGEAYRERLVKRPVNYQQQETQPRGPFIVCVDTSGSMGGFNERCAKAFCLALLKVALADNRRCYVMLFSNDVIHYELTADDGIHQAIRFLSQRFRGGTDLAACLEKVLNKLITSEWQDADAVVISDFIAQRLPDALVSRVRHHQKQQRFHAVSMSDHGKPAILRIFNYVWRFDTGLKSRLLRRWQR